MSTWLDRVKNSIFPLSVEQANIVAALREWFYSGHMHDLEEPSADCELCGHPDIRYQFTIRNRHTSAELEIGSECITKFDIPAIDAAGNALSKEETKSIVAKDRRKLVAEARKRRMISTLLLIAQKDTEFKILSFIDYFQERGAFTPNQLSTLLWRLQKFSVPYVPSDFKLTIKRNREKDQLLEMPNYKIRTIWPCMSSAQKRFYQNNKNTG